ncbi:MAG: DUF1801 domain-containing protein [Chloroflexota bacterium]|nr:DUF1801 domain-containing protein [Chloroflexota bacterium]MDE3101725.1 DUF1801 domain-containing protein [Chloroflexota bacterium]
MTAARGRARSPAAATVDEYLRSVDPALRQLLQRIRRTVRSAAPKATESISYGIPTFKQDGKRLIYLSAASRHCAVHMIGAAHLAEAKRRGFAVGRGSIRFTPERPLPDDLLKRIVMARLAEIAAGARRY